MQTTKTQDLPLLDTSCARDDCCTTADDGSRVCAVTLQAPTVTCDCTSGTCSCNTISSESIIIKPKTDEKTSVWKRVRGLTMFGLACVTSPCCTPLIVPIVLALMAGTPVAAWMGSNLGWVYGGLTLVSVVSFVIGWRWMKNHM